MMVAWFRLALPRMGTGAVVQGLRSLTSRSVRVSCINIDAAPSGSTDGMPVVVCAYMFGTAAAAKLV